MNCPHCGAEALPGNTFCHRCRKRIVAPSYGSSGPAAPSTPMERLSGEPPLPAPSVTPRRPAPPPPPATVYEDTFDAASTAPLETFKRPGIITLLAVLDLIGAAFCLILAVFMLVAVGSGEKDVGLMVFMAGIFGVSGLASLAAGVGLLKLRAYGRMTQIVLSCLGLLNLPVGTIISALTLVYLFKPGVKLLFSERDPADLSEPEQAQVAALSSSGSTTAIVVAVCLLGGVCGIGVIAAIAIPSLLRARVSANESAAIGQLRSLVVAEAAYGPSNQGLYDRIECLSAPANCIPGYGGGAFLTEPLAPTAHGYNFTFHPGPPRTQLPSQASPTSLERYAYVASPVVPNQTGVRSFCIDHSGYVCATGGAMPPVENATCPAACQPLR